MCLLTPAARILLALARAGRPLTFSELIDSRDRALKANVDLNLKRLIAEGLVEKRGRSYVITSAGRVRVESLIAEVIGR